MLGLEWVRSKRTGVLGSMGPGWGGVVRCRNGMVSCISSAEHTRAGELLLNSSVFSMVPSRLPGESFLWAGPNLLDMPCGAVLIKAGQGDRGWESHPLLPTPGYLFLQSQVTEVSP